MNTHTNTRTITHTHLYICMIYVIHTYIYARCQRLAKATNGALDTHIYVCVCVCVCVCMWVYTYIMYSKTRQLKSIWIWANRPSSKGSKLLFPGIKANKFNLYIYIRCQRLSWTTNRVLNTPIYYWTVKTQRTQTPTNTHTYIIYVSDISVLLEPQLGPWMPPYLTALWI